MLFFKIDSFKNTKKSYTQLYKKNNCTFYFNDGIIETSKTAKTYELLVNNFYYERCTKMV
jgi:hypothetical protein